MKKYHVQVYFIYEIEAKNKRQAAKKGLAKYEEARDKSWVDLPSVKVEEPSRWL